MPLHLPGSTESQRGKGREATPRNPPTQPPPHSLEGARVQLAKHQTFSSRGEGVDRLVSLPHTSTPNWLFARNTNYIVRHKKERLLFFCFGADQFVHYLLRVDLKPPKILQHLNLKTFCSWTTWGEGMA
jgi:hypothetical protein